MAQISAGTVQVVNQSTTVKKNTVGGPSWATVGLNELFGIQTDEVLYPIASFTAGSGSVLDSIQLQAPYQGASNAAAQYAIVQDFSPGLHIPLINTGDVMTGAIYNEAARILDFLGVQKFTGDMSQSVYDPTGIGVVDGVQGSVVLGAASANIGLFPEAVVVPRYAGHPDAAWQYGPYDDHFDGITINSKWTKPVSANINVAVGGSQVCLSGYGSGASGSVAITENIPLGPDFTVTWKWRFGAYVYTVSGELVRFWMQISGSLGFARVLFYFQTNPAFNQTQNLLFIRGDAGLLSAPASPFQNQWMGDVPPYWKCVYRQSGNGSVVFSFSFDGVNFQPYVGGLTNAQTYLNSGHPSSIQLGGDFSQNCGLSLSIDWVRYISP